MELRYPYFYIPEKIKGLKITILVGNNVYFFVKDGAFYMNGEVKETVGVGIFDQINPENIEKKCREILSVCEK